MRALHPAWIAVVLAPLAAIMGATYALAQIAAPTSPAPTLQPHRAVYDISLDETGAAMSIASITGRVVYELMGSACEGYAQNMRFVTETTTTEGQSSTTDLRTASWESADARRMRFSSSTYTNEQLAEQTQGNATKTIGSTAAKVDPPTKIAKPAAAGREQLAIEVTKPASKSARIEEPVYFPIDHSAAIIRRARAGEPMFAGNLYDGSEGGEKYYFTAAAIGRVSTSDDLRAVPKLTGDATRLAGLKSWPVAIAYFKPEGRHIDQLPLYEMTFRFHENGVTSSLMIDHGDYRLRGELTELTLLEQTPCR